PLYAAWEVTTQHHAPWIAGALAAVVLAGAIGLLFERLIVRPMADAPRMTVAVATIGLLSLMLAFESVFFGPSPRLLRPPIAGLGTKVFGVYVSPTQWLSLGVVVVVGVGLATFLRRTDFGLGVLAAAEDPTAVRLVGVRLSRVSAFVWGTSAVLSAVAALLIEPTVGVIAPGALAGGRRAAILLIARALAAFPILTHRAMPRLFRSSDALVLSQGVALAAAALSLNLLLGYAGQISLGHGALLGVGAFTSGVLAGQHGLPMWVGIPAAAVLGAAFAFILGIPSLRLRGLYLAMVTLAFGYAAEQSLFR